MKLTIDELKGINVETYLAWQIETVEKIYKAYFLIPIKTKELHRIAFREFAWYMYFEELKPKTATYNRYQKYKELVKAKQNELCAEINLLYDTLDGVVLLVDAKNVAKVIKDNIAFNRSTENIPLSTVPTSTGEPFTKEDYNKLQETERKYFSSGWKFTTNSINYAYAKTVDFADIIGSIDGMRTIFNSHLDYDLSKFRRMQKINSNAEAIVLKEATEKEFKYLDWVLKVLLYKEFFTNIDVVAEFASLAYYARVANQGVSTETISNSPLMWVGKPAQLGYVLHLLESNGFIDAPKKRDGETNYSEFARIVSRAFQFEGNNDKYLAKSLNPESNNMEGENKDKFTIPHIKDIG